MTRKKKPEPITAADFDKLGKQLQRRGQPVFHAVRLTKPQTEEAHAKLAALDLIGRSEERVIGFMLRMAVMCTLPHSDRTTQPGEVIIRRNGRFTLSLEPRASKGIPYGIYPRLIMAYLTQEVQRTKRREISLGRSLTEFMRELGITPTYGKRGTTHALRDQMERLFSARIWLEEQTDKYKRAENASFAQRWALWWDPRSDDGQQPLFESSVTLSEDLFNEMLRHPIPFDKRTLAALKDSALGVDVYLWTSWRASYADSDVAISWAQLAEQLGADYSDPKEFARQVKKQLARIAVAWPGLRYETPRGRLILKPSAPHIPKIGVGG